MRTLALALLLSPSIALACAQAVPPPILEPPRVTAPPIMVPPVAPLRAAVAADDDIREAVFRHQFDHNASGLQKNAKVFCLQIEGNQDPSPELLRRFDGNAPRVKKASLCSFKPGHARGGVVDDTGAPALIFRVDTLQHPGDDAAIVEGGYFEAGLSASGNVYELVREGNLWIVKKDTMKWIS
jgi:hypothetical protein